MTFPNFLYSDSYHFFNIIIIILIFLLPAAIGFGLFLWRIAYSIKVLVHFRILKKSIFFAFFNSLDL